MIKKLKNFICKLFNIKACQCDEVDEHVEFFTKVPESDIPVHVEPCPIHRYFKENVILFQRKQKEQKGRGRKKK